ncbi:SIS domain-containing protein [Paenibacillus peoriae]|uniref:SIS domain-containing protein n=1 Tax=Paenibacillus peoriae TaxID=59893 RepID=A0A7H0Y2I4_9BACL|nr:SIS domain-containing protein [Paenibacillus peoriae]
MISCETALAINSSLITEEDLVIFTSFSGETKMIKGVVRASKIKNVMIAAITKFGSNFLFEHNRLCILF